MLTYEDEGIAVSLAFDRWDGSRSQWQWTLSDASTGRVLATACDLRSGSDSDDGAADMLKAFLSFLSAWAESVSYRERTGHGGENADLFPASLLDACDAGTWEQWADTATVNLGFTS